MLDELGWDAGWAAALDGVDGTVARVARVDRGAVRALTADGMVSATPPVDETPVTGDWVALRPGEDGGVVVAARAPRRTALVRRDPGEHPAPQTLAANMDEVWVVHAADMPLRAGWLDRALVVAFGSYATPLIVITKADLVRKPDKVTRRARALAPHVPVLVTSVVDGRGISDLAERLRGGRCAALLGRSGCGKSSLVNALAGRTVERTGTVRARDRAGRHTTTRRALVPVAGGSVIDTPGVRALGLWEPGTGLRRTFPDIAELAEHCRFTDCEHRDEPDCAVLRARDEGTLDPDRYRRYMTLRESQ